MSQPLTFINPAIIERIENGSFVPTRRAPANLQMQERRNSLSPLAVAKRAIRYEPLVFNNRQPAILQLADALNQPAKKIFLVGGAQGSGKTSLARGIIELLGSENEQLLWFEANRHTDFDEIIQFLIQYITYIGAALQPSGQETPVIQEGSPTQRLASIIRQVGHVPLLLVLDNVEYLVDGEMRFNSYPFKEMLNFLLEFPNIKMLLIGERLPYADMSPNQTGVEHLTLEGLPTHLATLLLPEDKPGEEAQALLPDAAILEQAATPEATSNCLVALCQKTHGQPWLLKVLSSLHHHNRLDYPTINRLLEARPHATRQTIAEALARQIYHYLPDSHRRLLHVLSMLRHPISANTLLKLVQLCYPALGADPLERGTIENWLEHSLLRGILKVNYPPQEVLEHVRRRRETGQQSPARPLDGPPPESRQKFRPWYELYHAVRQWAYQNLSAEEKERMHGILQDFYLYEKGLEASQRTLRMKSRAMFAEAKFHGSFARDRKNHARSSSGQPAGDGVNLSTKTYLAQSGISLPSVRSPLTLADYKNMPLPGEPPPAEAENTEPRFIEMLENAAGKSSLHEQLLGLELTEEEQALLFQKDQELQKFQANAHPAPPAAETEAVVPLIAVPSPAEGYPIDSPNNPQLHATQSPPSITPPAKTSVDFADLLASEAHLTAEEATEFLQEKRIQQRLTAAVAAQDKPTMLTELVALAQYRASHGRYESASQCLEKALSLKSDASQDLLAEVYRLSGNVYKATYHHNAALHALSKAAVQIRKLMYEDDTVDAAWLGRLGQVYQDLGEVYAYRKQYTDAEESFQQALRWYHSADDTNHQAEIHFQLANVYEDQNQPTTAIEHYQKALELDEQTGNKASAAASLSNLGHLYRASGQWEQALHCYQRALQHDRAAQNIDGQFQSLDAICTVYLWQGNLAQAEITARHGLAHALQQESALWQASFYLQLGRLSELNANWKQALHHYELAYSSGLPELSSSSLQWLQQKIAEIQA